MAVGAYFTQVLGGVKWDRGCPTSKTDCPSPWLYTVYLGIDQERLIQGR